MYKSKNKSADTQRVTATHTLLKTVRAGRDRYSLYANFKKRIQVPASGDRLFHKLGRSNRTEDVNCRRIGKCFLQNHNIPTRMSGTAHERFWDADGILGAEGPLPQLQHHQEGEQSVSRASQRKSRKIHRIFEEISRTDNTGESTVHMG